MKIQQRLGVRLAAIALFPLVTACGGGMGGLGALGDILAAGTGAGTGQPQQAQVRAEIQQVDTRQQRVQFRAQDGRTGTAIYDQNTQLIYQQQQYPMTALEQGDLVLMDLQQDQNGTLYVGRILVEQSVQQRTGQQQTIPSGGQAQLYQGTVRQIDAQRGTFQLQTQYGILTVSLPYNPPRAVEDRFNTLRVGSTIGVEGVSLGDARVELVRFR